MVPGRSAALKLVGGQTADSVMLFEETAPSGTETTFHLHRDSDEVAWVLSGEITFQDRRRGDRWRAGHLCLHATRRAACLEKHDRRDRTCPLPLYPGQGRWVLRG